jgi:ubiquinone/menaquinone biosynthesis C-methylase UbiE
MRQTGGVNAARRTASWLLVLLATSATAAEPRGPHDATARHSFADVAHWASVFDDPKRDGWQKPDEVVRALALRPGMAVADLGAGTGYFMGRLSRAVAPGGTVFALEPEPNLVVHLRGRAEKEGLDNVVPVLASMDDARLPIAGVDVLLVVDTYHHIDDRPAYFRRVRRMLRGAGRVAIIDWQKRETPAGPPPEHRLAREHVVAEMTAAGYRLVHEPDFLPYQYFLVFAPGA